MKSAVDFDTVRKIGVLPLQGDRKPSPFLCTKFNEADAHFSPDGRSIAYVSDESRSDLYEGYVRPFASDSSATDTSGGGAKWRPRLTELRVARDWQSPLVPPGHLRTRCRREHSRARGPLSPRPRGLLAENHCLIH
jgi:hypothetical protein